MSWVIVGLFILLFIFAFAPIGKRIKMVAYFFVLILLTAAIGGNISEKVHTLPKEDTIHFKTTSTKIYSGYIVPIDGEITAVTITILQDKNTQQKQTNWYVINISNGIATMMNSSDSFQIGSAINNDLAIITYDNGTVTYIGISKYNNTEFPLIFENTFINSYSGTFTIMVTHIEVNFKSYTVVTKK